MRTASRRIIIGSLLVISIGQVWCYAKEKAQITISHIVAPSEPRPEGLKAVAVIDSAVRTQGANGDQRDQKWSQLAADLIEDMLLRGSRMVAPPLSVADRRATRHVLMEQDLKLAGLVEGATATRAGKLLDVQGLVASDIVIDIDIRRNHKTTIDWGGILSGATQQLGQMAAQKKDHRHPEQPVPRYTMRRQRPPGPVYWTPPPRRVNRPMTPALGTKVVEEVRRSLSVRCSFSLIDATTGQVVLRYAPSPVRKEDKASPDFFFGQFVDPADLDPVDQFIGELVEQTAREFVGMIVPVQVAYTYEIMGRGNEGEAGIRAIRADDFQTAAECFQKALRKDPKEHDTLFALGVTCELLNQWDQAIDYYRQASGTDDLDRDESETYLTARKRLAAYRGRIILPDAQPRWTQSQTDPSDTLRNAKPNAQSQPE